MPGWLPRAVIGTHISVVIGWFARCISLVVEQSEWVLSSGSSVGSSPLHSLAGQLCCSTSSA